MSYSLLIVDDDAIERDGLTNNIRWNEADIIVVGTAANGNDGCRLVTEKKPDIVLTDIKMPLMDGVCMATSIMRVMPNTRIVFLTAYEDFSYAKEAASLGVHEYVLKYSCNDEILDAVRRECRRLDHERAIHSKLQHYRRLEEEQRLYALLAGNENAGACAPMFAVAAVLMFGKGKTPCADSKSIKRLCDEHLMGSNIYALQFEGEVLLICCLESDTFSQYERQILQTLCERLKKGTGTEAFFLTSDVIRNAADLSLVCRTLLSLIPVCEEHTDGASKGLLAAAQIKNFKNPFGLYQKMTAYVEENYTDSAISLGKVADAAFVSGSYACTIFRRFSGSSINSYILAKRMDLAKRLLLSTDLTISDISLKTGYDNSRYFMMLFKRHSGKTPTEFRKGHIKD